MLRPPAAGPAPEQRHPRSGLHKRPPSFDELFALDPGRTADPARYPAQHNPPGCGGYIPQLEDDWTAAAANPAGPPAAGGRGGGRPVVPKFVRDFTGSGDVRDPGRAVRKLVQWRCKTRCGRQPPRADRELPA